MKLSRESAGLIVALAIVAFVMAAYIKRTYFDHVPRTNGQQISN